MTDALDIKMALDDLTEFARAYGGEHQARALAVLGSAPGWLVKLDSEPQAQAEFPRLPLWAADGERYEPTDEEERVARTRIRAWACDRLRASLSAEQQQQLRWAIDDLEPQAQAGDGFEDYWTKRYGPGTAEVERLKKAAAPILKAIAGLRGRLAEVEQERTEKTEAWRSARRECDEKTQALFELRGKLREVEAERDRLRHQQGQGWRAALDEAEARAEQLITRWASSLGTQVKAPDQLDDLTRQLLASAEQAKRRLKESERACEQVVKDDLGITTEWSNLYGPAHFVDEAKSAIARLEAELDTARGQRDSIHTVLSRQNTRLNRLRGRLPDIRAAAAAEATEAAATWHERAAERAQHDMDAAPSGSLALARALGRRDAHEDAAEAIRAGTHPKAPEPPRPPEGCAWLGTMSWGGNGYREAPGFVAGLVWDSKSEFGPDVYVWLDAEGWHEQGEPSAKRRRDMQAAIEKHPAVLAHPKGDAEPEDFIAQFCPDPDDGAVITGHVEPDPATGMPPDPGDLDCGKPVRTGEPGNDYQCERPEGHEGPCGPWTEGAWEAVAALWRTGEDPGHTKGAG